MTALCPTAQLVAKALSASSEAVLLLSTSGVVLHLNPAAKQLFDTNDDDPKSADVASFFNFSKPWSDVLTEEVAYKAATASKKDGSTFAVTVGFTKLGGCPCCDALYVCAYIHGAHDDLHRLKLIKDTVDASFDPMLTIDEKGIILIANSAAIQLFGWTYEEFVGNNVNIICGGGHAEHHNDYIQRYLTSGGVKRVMGTQREVPARKKDGTEFPVELGIKEIWEGTERQFCAFFKDLRTQKQHEAELLHKESLTQGMINASFDPMFQIDEQGIIRVVNQAAASLFGYTREEFIGSNISIICGGDHGAHHDEYIARYLHTGTKRIIGRKRQVTAKRKDGSEFDMELGVQEVVSSTGERAFCGYIRDLTQQKLDKKRLRMKDALIHDKFFGSEEDVTADAENEAAADEKEEN